MDSLIPYALLCTIPQESWGIVQCLDLTEKLRRLRDLAQSQHGFFTTKQAIRSGFAERTHADRVT
jgi:hypothetical protein